MTPVNIDASKIKLRTVRRVSIWAPVNQIQDSQTSVNIHTCKSNFIESDPCQYGPVKIRFCTVWHGSGRTRVHLNYVYYHIIQMEFSTTCKRSMSKRVNENLYSWPRVNIDTGQMKICKFLHLSIWTRVTRNFIQRFMCRTGHVSHYDFVIMPQNWHLPAKHLCKDPCVKIDSCKVETSTVFSVNLSHVSISVRVRGKHLQFGYA